MNQIFANQAKSLGLLAILFILSSCGGGGSDDIQSSALSVDIGDPFAVTQGLETVTVRSVASGGSAPYTYSWSIQPNEYEDDADALDAAEITLTLPTDLTASLTLLLTLQVTDATGSAVSEQSQMTINVLNNLPIVSLDLSENDGVLESAQTLTLTSNWQDAEDGTDVSSATIAIEQLSGQTLQGLPDDGILFDLTDSTEFPVSSVIETGQLINNGTSTANLKLTLTVEDTQGGITTDSQTINMLPVSESSPIVDAGDNQTVYEGEKVVLTGTVSNSDTPLVQWSQISGSSVLAIADENALEITLQTPTTNVTERYSFQLKATSSESQKSAVDSVEITVLPMPDFDGINDTGITDCADATSNQLNCGLSLFPGQDGDHGRDVAASSSEFRKQGAGESAFDFSLIDENGDQIPWAESGQSDSDAISEASCIRDNVTGLIWEIKQSSGIRAHSSTYTWFNTTGSAGGTTGTQNSTEAQCEQNTTLTSCDTQAYQNEINRLQLCGGSDWRLPTVRELISILNFSRPVDKLARSANGDILWPEHAKTDTAYWTQTSALFGVSDEDGPVALRAWGVNLSTANEASFAKETPLHLILVR